MDFSQLPKMSKTPTAPPAEGEPAIPAADVASTPAPRPPRAPIARDDFAVLPSGGFGFGGVWISLICGILCLMFGLNFIKWATATLAGKPFSTGWFEADGVTPVTYFHLQGGTAWTETGLFLMGVALLLDAALMFVVFRGRVPHRALLMAAVGITGLAVALNTVLLVWLLSMGITPLTSIIAILVGGMILFDHLPLLKQR